MVKKNMSFVERLKRIWINKGEILYYSKSVIHAKQFSNRIEADFVIFTIAFNNAVVIEEQIKRVKKHCKSKYQYCVFDNSSDENKRKEIEKVCNTYEICYFSLPRIQTKLVPSESHGVAINYVLRNIIKKNRKIQSFLILDHDVFPFKDFTRNELTKGQEMYGMLIEIGDLRYIWPGFFFCYTDKIHVEKMDFKPAYGGDTGSGNRDMLYSDIDFDQYQFIDVKRPYVIKDEKDGANRQKNGIDIFDDSWVHFIGASDWMGANNFEEKYEAMINYLKGLQDNEEK